MSNENCADCYECQKCFSEQGGCAACYECQKCFEGQGQASCAACFDCQRCFGCMSGISPSSQTQIQQPDSRMKPEQWRGPQKQPQRQPQGHQCPQGSQGGQCLTEDKVKEIILDVLLTAGVLDESARRSIALKSDR